MRIFMLLAVLFAGCAGSEPYWRLVNTRTWYVIRAKSEPKQCVEEWEWREEFENGHDGCSAQVVFRTYGVFVNGEWIAQKVSNDGIMLIQKDSRSSQPY